MMSNPQPPDNPYSGAQQPPQYQYPAPSYPPPYPAGQYPPQNQYPTQGQYPAPAPTNGLAVAALVCGILGFFTGLSAIAAVICGHVSLSQLRRTGGEGRGMAIAGLITGYIVIGFMALGVVFFCILWAELIGAASSADTTVWSSALGAVAGA
jgi:hypothetical protein